MNHEKMYVCDVFAYSRPAPPSPVNWEPPQSRETYVCGGFAHPQAPLSWDPPVSNEKVLVCHDWGKPSIKQSLLWKCFIKQGGGSTHFHTSIFFLQKKTFEQQKKHIKKIGFHETPFGQGGSPFYDFFSHSDGFFYLHFLSWDPSVQCPSPG